MEKHQKTFNFFEHGEKGSELVGRINSKRAISINDEMKEILDSINGSFSVTIKPVEIDTEQIEQMK